MLANQRFTVLPLLLLMLLGLLASPLCHAEQTITLGQVIDEAKVHYAHYLAPYYSHHKVDVDPQTTARVQSVMKQLVPAAIEYRPESRNWPWEVHLITADRPNAFSMAGGKVIISTGLIDKLQLTNGELAGILAHEMSHSLCDHALKMERLTNGSPTIVGAIINANGVKNERASDHTLSLAEKMEVARKQESEADLLGMRIMAMAGFSPENMISVLQKLPGLQGNSIVAFMYAHPDDNSRINAAQAYLPTAMKFFLPTPH